MTFLIASFFAETLEDLETRSKDAWQSGADAVEVRVDALRGSVGELNSFFRRHPNRQWLVTCRTAAEGGHFNKTASDAGRFVLDAANDTGAWIDIELAAWRADPQLCRDVESYLAKNPATKLVLSAHFFQTAPPNLLPLVEEMPSAGTQAVAKVAYLAEHVVDSFAALDLMRRYKDRVVAICMGECGAWTRVLAAKLGAFATFVSLPQESSTAPGQWTASDLLNLFRWKRIDDRTQVFGVAGDPVAHSLSPLMFNHWFQQHGINAVYLPLRIGTDRGGLSGFLDECQSRPWLDIKGLSVTIPHKSAALQCPEVRADGMSHEIGAANTLVCRDGGWEAYNTDCYAAVDSLSAALELPREKLTGLTVDVLGAGGAARAVCYGLAEMGCRVVLYARSKSNAFERWGVVVRDWSQRFQSNSEVLINCTPLGLWPHGDESPMPAEALKGRRLVFDLVYRPLKTRLLKEAEHAGCRTLGGLDMFVRQAATQLSLWTSASTSPTSAIEFLRANLAGHDTAGSRSSVALIGARASGKTTVGRHLAGLLGLTHVDTDELIAASAGKTIAQIFASEGEAGFRTRERQVIGAALAQAPAVFSLGGGAVLQRENIDAIRRVARIVWLTAPAQILAQRIKSDPKSAQSRPSLSAKDAEAELVEALLVREPLYRAAAELAVETSRLTPDEVAQKIASWLTSAASSRT